VVEVAVVVREDQPGEKRLVAYYVSAGRTPTTTELRSFLKDRMPDYMIPGLFVQVEAMPVTPSGKLDRRALPSPQSVRPDLETFYVAPRTPIEQMLVGIWKEILSVEKVSVEDHFFDLGGHSLLAAQLVSRVREAFQVEIPLRWFFVGEPTVAGLAQVIEEFQIEEAEADELASALAELDGLSDEEVKALLMDEVALPLQE
jgi:acyl carrier protein